VGSGKVAKVIQVDLATLLKPISDRSPSGVSLRRGAVYDRIKEARREDDPSLSRGIWQTKLKKASWVEVEELCLEALKLQSKDARIAAWLTEAWLHLYGAEGIEQGFRLFESLSNRFWDTMHPEIDEDGDLDGRMAPFIWINDKLSFKLKIIPLTRPQTKEPEIYNWNDWERASLLERSNQQASENEVTTAQFMTCVLLTPAAFYIKLERDLSHLWDATEDLERAVDKGCGRSMSFLWQFRQTLKEIKDFVSKALDQKAEEEPEGDLDEEREEPRSRENSSGVGVRWGPIRNRAEAYQRLAEAADFLMRSEPHSPTPHLVKRAVTWGSMSFTELIQELVHDKHDLNSIYSLLGIHMD